MKLKINDKYEDVGFWSFAKCWILVDLAITLIIFALVFVLGILIEVAA